MFALCSTQLNSQDRKLLLNLFFAQGFTPSCHSFPSSSFFSYLKVQVCNLSGDFSGHPVEHRAEHYCSPSARTAQQPGQETAAKPLLCTRIYTILPHSSFFFLLLKPKSASEQNISVLPLLPQLNSQDRKLLLNLFFAQGSTPSCHSNVSSSFFTDVKVQLSRTLLFALCSHSSTARTGKCS